MGQTWGWWVASSEAVFVFVLSSSPSVWHQFMSLPELDLMLKLWRMQGGGGVCPWICVHTLSHLSFYVFLRDCRFFFNILTKMMCSLLPTAYRLLESLSKVCAETAAADLKPLVSPWFAWTLSETLNKHVWQSSSYDQLQTSDQGKWRGCNSSLPQYHLGDLERSTQPPVVQVQWWPEASSRRLRLHCAAPRCVQPWNRVVLEKSVGLNNSILLINKALSKPLNCLSKFILGVWTKVLVFIERNVSFLSQNSIEGAVFSIYTDI